MSRPEDGPMTMVWGMGAIVVWVGIVGALIWAGAFWTIVFLTLLFTFITVAITAAVWVYKEIARYRMRRTMKELPWKLMSDAGLFEGDWQYYSTGAATDGEYEIALDVIQDRDPDWRDND